MHTHGIGAETEEDSLSQTQNAGIAPDQVHAQSQDRQRQVFTAQIQVIVRQHPYRVEERQENDQQNHQHHFSEPCTSPSSPCYQLLSPYVSVSSLQWRALWAGRDQWAAVVRK